jgi:hypothetical protein
MNPESNQDGGASQDGAAPAEQHRNDGPAHEGRRSNAGGTYGDFNRGDKSGGASTRSDPAVVDVEDVFDNDMPGVAGT